MADTTSARAVIDEAIEGLHSHDNKIWRLVNLVYCGFGASSEYDRATGITKVMDEMIAELSIIWCDLMEDGVEALHGKFQAGNTGIQQLPVN